MKNRPVGDAELYKGLFNSEPLRAADGVRYLRDTLRPHFIKGAQSVFFRWSFFFQFTRAKEGHVEQVDWKMLIAFRTLQRFLDGHVADDSLTKEQRQNQYLADVAQENAERLARGETALDPNTPENRERWNTAQVNNHGTHKFLFSTGNGYPS